jgi:transcriptional regulatory protein RtcR
VDRLLAPERAAALDRCERTQLEDVLAVCLEARSLSEAGRVLFSASRARRTTANDAGRLRKYLARHGLAWGALRASRAP